MPKTEARPILSLYHGDMPFTHPFCDACPKDTPHANIERQGDCVQIRLGRVWLPLCHKHLEELYRNLTEWFREEETPPSVKGPLDK